MHASFSESDKSRLILNIGEMNGLNMLFVVLFMCFSGTLAHACNDTLKVGDRSPEFKALDINGREVKVTDLKGKYVYIDVWATWCEPCKMEIPYLKELERKFQGKKIVFVSISSEKNRGKWSNMVKNEEMTGLQLSTGGDRSFMEAFRIDGIPRFILLDKKGRILNLYMTRPSNPKTEKTLRGLKGI